MSADIDFRTPVFWSEAQAAEILHVKPGTLRNMRITGNGPPFIKLGGRYSRAIYDPADVIEWANSKKVASTSDPRFDRGQR